MSKQTKTKPPPELEVIVIVRGGVAEIFQKPLGVTVVILDYDIEGVSETDPRIFRDADGNLCSIGRWQSRDEVNPKHHRHVTKDDLECGYFRLWKCPDCRRTIKVTYEELAVVGSPLCTDCDQPMDML
jgi:hypothetical protein